MPTFNLVSELTLATLSSHFTNSVRTFFVPCRGSARCGAARIQGRNAAIERYRRISPGKGKGSNVDPPPVRMKRSQKFWEFSASREGG